MTDTPKTIAELDEMRARTMQDLSGFLISRLDVWTEMMRLLREADAKAGLITVPREATEEMASASKCECSTVIGVQMDYALMLAASPFAEKPND